MANIKSKQKAIIENQKANKRNSAIESSVKTAIKKARKASCLDAYVAKNK